MRKLVFAGMCALLPLSGASHAMPITGPAMHTAAGESSDIEQAAYVHGGRRYCFSFDGWRGAGWYRCGYTWRRGLGWGGSYGWMGWEYGPAVRRFGGGGFERRNGRSFDRNLSVRGGRDGGNQGSRMEGRTRSDRGVTNNSRGPGNAGGPNAGGSNASGGANTAPSGGANTGGAPSGGVIGGGGNSGGGAAGGGGGAGVSGGAGGGGGGAAGGGSR